MAIDFEGNVLFLTCVNTWRNNNFVDDNEAGVAAGPKAGCIQ